MFNQRSIRWTLAAWFIAAVAVGQRLAAGDAPMITRQPTNVLAAPGTAIQFSVGVSGTAPIAYAWSLNGVSLSGGTNSTLVVSNVGIANLGSYEVTVTNLFGIAVSIPVTLDLSGPPLIVSSPTNQTVNAGVNVVLTVNATGSQPLYYYWLTNGVYFGGATNSTLTLTNISVTNAGAYSVFVTNAYGSATSTNAQVDVNGMPFFLTFPTNTFAFTGENAAFSATVYSTTPLSYQWYFEGTAISGATNLSVVLTNVTTNSVGYYFLQAANQYASELGIGGYLTVLPLPSPTLNFESPVFTSTNVTAGVSYLANGVETNLSFSILYNAALATSAVFYPTNLPPGTGVAISNAPGGLGIALTLPPSQPFGVGSTNIGQVSFTLVSGLTNTYAPYAIGLDFGSTPTPLLELPAAGTNNFIVNLPLPPVFTPLSNGPTLNFQTGLFDQTLEVVNAGGEIIGNVLVAVENLGVDSLTNQVVLYNAEAYLDGYGPIVNVGPLAPTETRKFILEYYISDRTTVIDPFLIALATPAASFQLPQTQPQLILTNRYVNGTYLVDFQTQTNQVYYVEYVSRISDFTNPAAAHISLPSLHGTGTTVQWVDFGPPSTFSAPTNGARFYRVLEFVATNVVSTNLFNYP